MTQPRRLAAGPTGMTRRFGARLGVALLLATAAAPVASSVMAAPASAATTVSITSPQDKAVMTTSDTPTIRGDADSDEYVCSIDLSVTPKGGQPAPTQTTTIDLVPNGGGRTASRTAQFTWAPALPVNGPYALTATAHTMPDPFCRLGQDHVATGTRSFALAVPAAAPTGVNAVPTADRHVDVTWAPNPEPDLSGYGVFRVARADAASPCPTAADPDRIATVAPSPKPAFTDTFGSADPGGVYCYTVEAERPGADPKKSVVLSAPSATHEVSVPPSDPAAAAGGASSDGAGAGSGAGAPAGGGGAAPSGSGLDLSNLSALQSKAKAAGAGKKPHTGLAPLPDGTYDPKLPFQAAPAQEDGADQPLVGTTLTEVGGSDHSGRVRTAAAVAASLVVFVVLGHLMLLRREVRRVPILDTVEP